MKLAELIAQKGIKMTVKRGAPVNRTFEDAEGWTVTLTYNKHNITVPFYMVRSHNGAEPTAEDVLDCLLTDATSADNARDFEDFASELGYDTDSREAERIYKACQNISKRLHQFLGDEFDTFAYETARS